MTRNYVVILTKDEEIIVFSSFKKACDFLNIKYWTHVKSKLPIEIKDYKISKNRIL